MDWNSEEKKGSSQDKLIWLNFVRSKWLLLNALGRKREYLSHIISIGPWGKFGHLSLKSGTYPIWTLKWPKMDTLGTFLQKLVGATIFSVKFYMRIHSKKKVNTTSHCFIILDPTNRTNITNYEIWLLALSWQQANYLNVFITIMVSHRLGCNSSHILQYRSLK